MKKCIFLAATFAALAMPQIGTAQTCCHPIVTPACLAPMDSANPNPQPRDLHVALSIDANGKASVGAQVCIVSNLPRIQDAVVQFAVFDQSGAYLGANGQQLGPLSPADGSTPPQPKIIQAGAAGFALPAGFSGPLLPIASVNIIWVECAPSTSGVCNPGTKHNDTFLRSFVPDGAAAKRPRTISRSRRVR